MIWLVVGLGNPGPDYHLSRHNLGFMVADRLAARWGRGKGEFRKTWNSELAEFKASGQTVMVQKPLQFMNLSGGPVLRAVGYFHVEPAHVVVVHDDLDLDFGRIKLKQGGGHGGHNGLRSIVGCIGADFLRVRGGVGRPNVGGDAKDERVVRHILGPFGKAEQAELPTFVDTLADAVSAIVADGLVVAMNRFNAGF